MEQTFSTLKTKDEGQKLKEGANEFWEHPLSTLDKIVSKDVEQKLVEGIAEFWDCSWHPLTKEVNQILKNGEQLDFSTFLGFLDHNYELSDWCDPCREKVYDREQKEIIQLCGENTYKYKFFVCNDCAQIIKYATFHY
uniref:Thiol oxidase n=1 Tax=Meloidogyne hapla TaxID=6305 RepID=A0A1I8BJQ0_MELHA